MSMRVAITGANGLVGASLIGQLDREKFDIVPIDVNFEQPRRELEGLDLFEADVNDVRQLQQVTRSADALIHFAWIDLLRNVHSNTRDPRNMSMARNAYRVAFVNGVQRVIIGSSNQAHGYGLRDSEGRITMALSDEPEIEYGKEKLEIETMGKRYAHKYLLDVVCVRIGNVNDHDVPKSTEDGKPQRWLSKRDLGGLITACLGKPSRPESFEIMYGVSDGTIYDWSNSFGYVPQDKALG